MSVCPSCFSLRFHPSFISTEPHEASGRPWSEVQSRIYARSFIKFFFPLVFPSWPRMPSLWIQGDHVGFCWGFLRKQQIYNNGGSGFDFSFAANNLTTWKSWMEMEKSDQNQPDHAWKHKCFFVKSWIYCVLWRFMKIEFNCTNHAQEWLLLEL